jgi:elongation factor P
MINVNDLKNGVVIEYDGNLMKIMEFQHVLQNKVAYVRVKMKNVRTGSIMETALKGSDSKFKLCYIDRRPMQYIYSTGDAYAFMDNETYEQIEISKDRLQWEMNFLKSECNVDITSYDGEILGIQLPAKVALKITVCEPAIRGDTVNKPMKPATVETGLEIKVPLFIEEGEEVLVRTDNGEYDSRA